MAPHIQLTEKEATLRQLLLDVSDYVSQTQHVPKPQLRFTGGWVRDKLLGMESKDIDVGIDSMTGLKFGLYMKDYLDDAKRNIRYDKSTVRNIAKIEANPDKSKHLETATTSVMGLDIDLVHLRKETYTHDSRNPQVEPATPEEDALRRDSTVNALFYNLQSETVEDFTGQGLKDLELKVIRTPLEPFQTFEDDPLRVLRCIRFASRLGYTIEPSALRFMGDSRITDALRVKISRERIGVEVEKMLTGPDPRMALKLIDEQNLYVTVFSNPHEPQVVPEDSKSWQQAYEFMAELLHDSHGNELQLLRSILLGTKETIHHGWLLCALLPWGKKEWPTELKLSSKSKRSYPAAAVVAREGLKVDNKVMEIVESAISHADEVDESMTTYFQRDCIEKPKQQKTSGYGSDSTLREMIGMSIRRWGPHWRSTVLYALLQRVMHGERKKACQEFSTWLLRLEELGLFEAHALRPIINGGELMKAFGKPSGPWLSQALEGAVRWQLRNPGSTDKDSVIEHLKRSVAS